MKKKKLKLPRNYAASQMLRILNFKMMRLILLITELIFEKFLLGTSKYGKNIQENINSVVTDGQFNNVALRHLLDEKNKGVFKSLNPLSVTFKDTIKFDVQNPVVGNLLSQVKGSTLTEAQVKKIFSDTEDAKIRARLDVLRNDNTGGNDDEDGPGGDGGNSNGGFTCPKCKKRGDNTDQYHHYHHCHYLPLYWQQT